MKRRDSGGDCTFTAGYLYVRCLGAEGATALLNLFIAEITRFFMLIDFGLLCAKKGDGVGI